ncbi:MAG: hypothetical protein A2161_06035 [Candidatus Schekmanbacteria bacterium RBG_13_48_7]|uniref:Uncharacterized protein n=1 Tax=Candidatus Schekmanbacteria bacterium RBG_13_48_7 TaxID=1817878 RepID=A0A1F7RN50_9BACT|nr:MAG: hypothetical protein A2161_06035 [Candidatus Schekmanbacteria bacterium RBG_13_48_7]
MGDKKNSECQRTVPVFKTTECVLLLALRCLLYLDCEESVKGDNIIKIIHSVKKILRSSREKKHCGNAVPDAHV